MVENVRFSLFLLNQVSFEVLSRVKGCSRVNGRRRGVKSRVLLLPSGENCTILCSLVFLPCDAMHGADYAIARCLPVRLPIRLSHAGILSKRLNVSSNFFVVG